MPEQTTGDHPITYPSKAETVSWEQIRDMNQSITDAVDRAVREANTARDQAAMAPRYLARRANFLHLGA